MADEAQRRWMEERVGHLRQLRDEIRVDLHLAGMDAKEAWQRELEPQVRVAERLVNKASEGARRRMGDVIDRLTQFRDRLRQQREHRPHA